MIKVLFVCLGNICRSPMAEFILKDEVKKRGISHKFIIESAATSYEEQGNPVHSGTVNILRRMGVPVFWRAARRINREDYEKFDYILCMEQKNLRDIKRIIPEDSENKISLLLSFCGGGDIADPWYSGNFEDTYFDIKRGIEGFLRAVEK